MMLFERDTLKLLEHNKFKFRASGSIVPGGTIYVKKFLQKSVFYLVEGGNIIELPLNKKQLIKKIGFGREINLFCKKEKNKLKNRNDLVDLIEHLHVIDKL